MKSILFKPELIKAIVEGRKTQTRRLITKPEVINQVPDKWVEVKPYRTWWFINDGIRETWDMTPRYQVGEVVYIKEVWRVVDVDTRTLRQPIHQVKVEYKLDCAIRWGQIPATITYTIADSWHSPIFLPETAARYFIQITDVRPERLQEITEVDAQAEGATRPPNYSLTPHYIEWYKWLWNKINPKYQWETNPWVFAYTFKRLEK